MVGALVCSALWGGNSVAVKLAQASFPPLFMSGGRFALAALATGSWCLARRVSLRIGAASVPLVLANGFLLYLQIGSFTLGTTRSSSIHSIILINVYPFFTALATRVWLPRFRLAPRNATGLFIAFVGVVVLFGDHLVLPDRSVLAGDLILVASAAILGLKVTYAKQCLDRIGATQLVFWEAVVAVPLFLATSLALEGLPAATITTGGALALAYQGWAVSFVAFLLWTGLLARHSPNNLAAVSFTTPLFGVLGGSLLLEEPVTVFVLAGGAIIALGIQRVNAR